MYLKNSMDGALRFRMGLLSRDWRPIANITKDEELSAHSLVPPGVFGNVADDVSEFDAPVETAAVTAGLPRAVLVPASRNPVYQGGYAGGANLQLHLCASVHTVGFAGHQSLRRRPVSPVPRQLAGQNCWQRRVIMSYQMRHFLLDSLALVQPGKVK